MPEAITNLIGQTFQFGLCVNRDKCFQWSWGISYWEKTWDADVQIRLEEDETDEESHVNPFHLPFLTSRLVIIFMSKTLGFCFSDFYLDSFLFIFVRDLYSSQTMLKPQMCVQHYCPSSKKKGNYLEIYLLLLRNH